MEGLRREGGMRTSLLRRCESELMGKWHQGSAGWRPLRSGLISLENECFSRKMCNKLKENATKFHWV